MLGILSLLWGLHLLLFELLKLFHCIRGTIRLGLLVNYYLDVSVRTLCGMTWKLSVSDLYYSLNSSCVFHHHIVLRLLLLWVDNLLLLLDLGNSKVKYSNSKLLHLTICIFIVLLRADSGWLCFCL